MILDAEAQREILLAAINAVNWPGRMIEAVLDVKKAVTLASISTGEDQVDSVCTFR